MITVYSKPNCMQCEFTKKWLSENDIQFKEVDVTQNDTALKTIERTNFKTMPVVIADGIEPFAGFQPDRLEALK